ncbi:Flagellar biosynthesis pathway, component FlhA [Hahella chejuensis KCTC 2396]|uniref:Flagellar biosynthesis pathway, component FlhA n=1 Tax=Hahella chejuensis (strain KCTC 2396) TaxID=349521 RepID=Q2SEX4_HAHCH|nr:flagellar biosynthesis protein FlhA [Hahella chejuensis]ABC30800.1 Flagellar biosynthesis pathway, component FlhA [Hahella chejuensis KCTC 2396]
MMSRPSMASLLGTRSELALVLGMVGILLVLFTPIPSQLLDVLLIINFSFGLLILLLTFFVDKPLGFSTFPSLLLIATLFRLSLNIAATRLILSDGDAGEVINAIGTYVVGGNYVIGLVVFLILIVVQYVVVTNGAQRVAEVAARFTLDSMPGKQMSIDADMNMGLIDEKEARERRQNIEREASFYGAMDGASKFVKGDAIAGILIILIDIIGGLTVGIAQRGLSWGEALHSYTLLTVGDGIVTQIPALVISTATGIIITRAATDAFLGDEISRQVTRYPKSLVIVTLGLLSLLLLPGIPALPIFIVASLMAALVVYAFKQNKYQEAEDNVEDQEDAEKDIYEELKVEPLEISLGPSIAGYLGASEGALMDEIKRLRKQLALELGFVLPNVKIYQTDRNSEREYKVCVHGAQVAEGELYSDRILAISAQDLTDKLPGVSVKDPTYGLPAVWIEENLKEKARQFNCTLVDPLTVMLTHVNETVRLQAPALLTRSETEKLMGRVRTAQSSLYEELVPNTLTLSDIQKVLQQLLQEKVSIRNIELIAEALVDAGKVSKDHEQLADQVRQKLGAEICQDLVAQDRYLHVMSMDPGIEQLMQSGIRVTEQGASLYVDPKLTEQVLSSLARQVEKMMAVGLKPVLITSPGVRRHIRKLSGRLLPHLTVLALTEVPVGMNIKSFSIVEVDRGLVNRATTREKKES